MVMCRTPSAEKVVDVLKTYIHFSYILESTLAQSVATPVELSPEVKIYNYETGAMVDQFQGGELFAFSVYLPTTAQKAMYSTMLNLSCDTMEIQALDLSGDTPTEPGTFLTPVLNGDPLMSKKLASVEEIHAFEGGNMNAEKNYTISNGKAKDMNAQRNYTIGLCISCDAGTLLCRMDQFVGPGWNRAGPSRHWSSQEGR